MDELLSIGEVARASGLSMSALRFYDRGGVLVPAKVSPTTGYRWYARSQLHEARLLARLRRIGLPLAEISTVLARRDQEVTARILDEHVRRLEEGLEAARTEVQRIRGQWAEVDQEAVVVVVGAELVEALRSVRYAVARHSQWPALEGVLIETAGSAVRFSATDRYRAAFHEIPARGVPVPVREVLPTALVDRLIERGADRDCVELRLGAGRVRVTIAGDVEEAELLDAYFPDLDPVVPEAVASTVVPREQLLTDLRDSPDVSIWYLGVGPDGDVALTADGHDIRDDGELALAGQFLTEAVEAVGPGQIQLDLAGPIAPLAIRRAHEPGSFSVIMPIRPEKPYR